MDGLGSEVGNKMRSAVKAKLIELGSGTAGYIDDELPDYVMIMVANKRSKEQMIGDLSLFLGKNTDIFVNWLHQVLEKLQEVTLPQTAVQKPSSKRKTSESSTDKRNDKKLKPKKRGTKDKSPDKSPERSTTPPIQTPPTSITDVFADHLIQKARKVIEPPLSLKKAEKTAGTTTDGFDIPTISEIAKKAVGAVVCRKEITELAELQKKIDQAKRQLRHMAEESEDDDFINLGADKMDFDAEMGNNGKETNSLHNDSEVGKSSESGKTHQKITFEEGHHDSAKKQSVLERLGTRGDNDKEKEKEKEKSERSDRSRNIISLSAHPVNSVVKVKPRPLIPRSKQASKNLLLRAVAEAQKSTALVKPPAREFTGTERSTKELYTKSFRNKIQKDNIVVEIATEDTDGIEVDDAAVVDELEANEEEYVPTPVSVEDDPFVYIPQAIHNNGLKDVDGPKTQFVVTLDSMGFSTKKPISQKDDSNDLRRNKLSSRSDERKRTPISNRIGRRTAENENDSERRRTVENTSEKSPSTLKRKRTPIKFDINDPNTKDFEPEKKRRSRSAERKSMDKEHRKSIEKDENRKRDSRSNERDSGESSSKIRTLKTSSQNKYDNLPPLSSAITVTSNETKITKKDRCKFYPACTRGDRCDYYHPTTPCKSFPNCKYASHVVPVSNYKKIVTTPLPTLSRFYPNCSNTLCEFYHPKPCKYGKSCTNKVECNFYHYDLPVPSNAPMPTKNKMKWVASAV